MFNTSAAFIGLRYARASKASHFIAFINFFSVTGIAVGITALIVVSSVMNGFEAQLKQRILGIVPHIMVDWTNPDNKQRVQLSRLPHVNAVAAQIDSEGLAQGPSGLQGVQIQAVEASVMQRYSPIASHMLYGQLSQLTANHYRVVIGLALARKLGVQLGDELRLMVAGATVYTPFGPLPSQRKFIVSGIFDLASQLDDKVVLINIDDGARLLRQQRGKLQQWRLFLDDAFSYRQVIKGIKHLTDAPTSNWRATEGKLFDAVKMEKNMMALMMMLIIAVAAFNIVSALVMVVTEKRGDIAILRTQGMTAGQILQIFLINGLYNGVKGTVLGLLGGLVLTTQLNGLLHLGGVSLVGMVGQQGLPVDIQWHQVTGISIFSLGLTFLATLFPAYRAARVAPAQALRYE